MEIAAIHAVDIRVNRGAASYSADEARLPDDDFPTLMLATG